MFEVGPSTAYLLEAAPSHRRGFITSWQIASQGCAALARLLKAVDVKAVDEDLGRRAGVLLGRAWTRDVVDASVVAVSATGDRIVTSDPGDIQRLVAAS